jgi:prepilin-type N-terminal cleavage/methylation domain-containing protein/prepilin-type processing-associated H-X9-DG protein
MRRHGFTLIELLVVISVLVVLTGLLVPVMNRVRQETRSTVCQSRIRQLQISLQAYENQHDTLPYGFHQWRSPSPVSGDPTSYGGTATVDLTGWWWFDFMKFRIDSAKHSNEDKILLCPSKRQEDPILEGDNMCGNYGVNRALCPSARDAPPFSSAYVRPPISTGSLRQPGSTLLVMDSGYVTICWWQATSEPPVTFTNSAVDTAYIPGLEINKDRVLKPGQILDAIGGRHPGKTVNVGLADGHTERKKASELLVEKTGEDTYANKTPLWEPR